MKIESSSITLENAQAVLAEGSSAIAAGDYVIDLSAVTTVDSSAIAVLIEWQREAMAHGGSLALNGVPKDIASLADLYGVEELFGFDGKQGR